MARPLEKSLSLESERLNTSQKRGDSFMFLACKISRLFMLHREYTIRIAVACLYKFLISSRCLVILWFGRR